MEKWKVVLGPVTGMVERDQAVVWCYVMSDREPEEKLYCHVYNMDDEGNAAGGIPGKPFPFKCVSKFPHRERTSFGRAYTTDIKFTDDGENFLFGIGDEQEWIEESNVMHRLSRFPKDGDVDFSFGLISCHKAYQYSGRSQKIVGKMWSFLNDKMGEKNARFLIQSGDQLYCDDGKNNAWKRCLKMLESPPHNHQEMVDAYREIYLDSWGFPEVQQVMRTFPQYMIWDDHEISNGWGARKKHWEKYRAVFDAAREAYIEFQDSHNPSSFGDGKHHYTFRFGNAAFLVTDLRGHRGEDWDHNPSPLMGDDQWRDIEGWFDDPNVKNSKILFVVTSVPVFHLSRGLGSLSFIKSDIADQWSTQRNKSERRKLLKLLLDWSGADNKPVFILGGDVHVGTEVCAVEKATGKIIHQVTSSPVTNTPAWFLDLILAIISHDFKFHLEPNDDTGKSLMLGRVVRRHRRRNFAIFDVSYEDGKPKILLNMFREGKKSLQSSDLLCKCREIKDKLK